MSRSQVNQLPAVATCRGDEPARTVSPLSSPADDLDQRTIRLLQEDGRVAFDVIGRRLGVSGGKIRNRMPRMRDAGMLGIVAVVDQPSTTRRTRCSASGSRPGSRSRGGSSPTGPSSTHVGERPVRSAGPEVCDEETELAIFLDEHVHGHSDVARVECMTPIGMFKNQFLLERHVP